MTLEEVRKQIDTLDPQIRRLLMERLDCSELVARAKQDSGDIRIYRADREEEILSRLGQGVPEERKAGYLAVVRKTMETSRMYQYGLLFDWNEGLFEALSEGLAIPEAPGHVKVRVVRPDRPNSMSSILSMVGDYGFNMETMTLLEEDREAGTVSFELVILGNVKEKHMQKLMFQLSMECQAFRIVEVF